jgi:hypothetical protein
MQIRTNGYANAARTIRGGIIFRFVDGHIVETWGVVDVRSQLKQLGAIPV